MLHGKMSVIFCKRVQFELRRVEVSPLMHISGGGTSYASLNWRLMMPGLV